ncbi:OmpA family protein [Vibrio rumoiensis]|uniref:OmpA-like domain-containing protein n=1 Tax=Vibrio rumoiensis 1S-45 TaxID=1188252 RepID=A0A1E5E2U9_9VIBR|nr:OmpA family protein [Vibrio rumoiensis]OEF25877.1 hypothetical protein A1QC_08135 [Vibrio rumoiensis 1S-45]
MSLLGLSLSATASDTTIDRSGLYLGAKTGWAEFNSCIDNACDDALETAQADRDAALARAKAAELALAADKPQIVYDSNSFATNSATMSSTAKVQTKGILEALKADSTLKARIVGHTDSTGSAAYNVTLSKKRAEAVADYLEYQGIDASRITTQGLGESNPVAINTTEAGRSKNRRVEVFITQ